MNTHVVNRAGVSVEIDIDALAPDIVAQLVRHGLTQKIGDAAAASAKIAAETGETQAKVAEALMLKVRDALLAGDWGVIRTGEGVSETVAVQRMVAKAAFKESVGAKSEKWAKFTGLSDPAQSEALDKIWAGNAEKLTPRFDAEMTRRKIAREAKAKGVSIKLDF